MKNPVFFKRIYLLCQIIKDHFKITSPEVSSLYSRYYIHEVLIYNWVTWIDLGGEYLEQYEKRLERL